MCIRDSVGSGKTAVAFGAMYLAWKSGFQAALMAPTEVLAQQHFEDAQALFAPLGARVGLLTGSLTKKQHAQAHEALSSGDVYKRQVRGAPMNGGLAAALDIHPRRRYTAHKAAVG